METPEEIEDYFDRLWPILRSITGDGVRRTHDILAELVPLERMEIPSGTSAFDWTVPKEWVARSAYVVAPEGRTILDVRDNNLHLLNYSTPFRGVLSRAELDQHLHSLPNNPDAIPYVTSYYAPRWGFCLSQHHRDLLPEGQYEVVVDTDLVDGSLTLSEAVLPGEDPQEVIFSTYTCHPSMANNELSGPLVTAFLYQRLAQRSSRRLTYRFVFLPETIGSIVYLSLRGEHLRRSLTAGYVVTCCGDAGPYTLKRSRRGDSLADRAAMHVLRTRRLPHKVLDFFPHGGSDERQYCSPGFNLPVASLMRSMYGEYDAYHTSFDNKEFISFEALQETVGTYEAIVDTLEANGFYRSLSPHCEPQLGRRGLYPSLGQRDPERQVSAMLWVLNYADGAHDLLWIAERGGFTVMELQEVARKLKIAELIEEVSPPAA